MENQWNQREEDKLLLEFTGRPNLDQLYNMIWTAQGAAKQDFKFDGIASEWGTTMNNLTRRN